jgi:hypothetical protein
MDSHSNWLPRNHEALYNQANETVNYLTTEVKTRIGITGVALEWYTTEFTPKHTAFNAAYINWRNTAERNPSKIATLQSAETEFNDAYRTLYNGYLRNNPLVTDTDLVAMGLPKHPSGIRTAPSKPEEIIQATPDTSKIGVIGIHYRTKNGKGIAKPKHVRGAEIVWAILDTPPKDWSELIHSSFDTRTPAQLSFSGNDRGKTVYFALRWENNIGQKGDWSEIYSAIIP